MLKWYLLKTNFTDTEIDVSKEKRCGRERAIMQKECKLHQLLSMIPKAGQYLIKQSNSYFELTK